MISLPEQHLFYQVFVASPPQVHAIEWARNHNVLGKRTVL